MNNPLYMIQEGVLKVLNPQGNYEPFKAQYNTPQEAQLYQLLTRQGMPLNEAFDTIDTLIELSRTMEMRR